MTKKAALKKAAFFMKLVSKKKGCSYPEQPLILRNNLS